MDYEQIIEEIGGFGRWQVFIFVTLIFPDIFMCFTIMLPVFIGAEPSWNCIDLIESGTNLVANHTFLKEYGISGNHSSNITEDIAKQCDSCENHIYGEEFTSIVSQWDLVCSRDYISDLISTIQMSGLLVGAAIFAQVSDSFGRKKAQFGSVAVGVIGGVLSSFSTHWQMFAAFRFICGVSAGGYYCVSCVYPVEFVPPRWRAVCGNASFWGIAQCLLALTAYFVRDWRQLTLILSGVGIFYAVAWCWVPESPRWLAQKGKTEEAISVFSNIAKKNGLSVPELSAMSKLNEGKGNGDKQHYTYWHLFKSARYIVRTLAAMSIWFVLYLSYYSISLNVKNLSGNRYINQVYGGIMDFAGILAVILFVNILGRRVCMIVITLGGVFPNIILFVLHFINKEETYPYTVNGVALTGRAFMLAGVQLVMVYSAEIFPTDIRNVGVGAGSISARVGMLLGPQIVYLGTHYKYMPYLIMCVLCTALLPVYFLLPETTGKPLDDDYNTINTTKHEKSNIKLTEINQIEKDDSPII